MEVPFKEKANCRNSVLREASKPRDINVNGENYITLNFITV
jgi:hypothetical protein